MPRDLRDRVIVITGASSGIGAATALECARAGMDVILAARRVDRLQAIADEIEALGRRSLAVACDVDQDGDVERLIARTLQAMGRLDAAFANAGYGLKARVLDTTDAQARAIFETNFFGTLRLLRAAAPALRANPVRDGLRGHLLICSSAASEVGLPMFGLYSATKAAQDSIAGALRAELASERIAVTSVHPIGTLTEFFATAELREAGREPADAAVPATPPPRGGTPLALRQTPDRVARAIVRAMRRRRPPPEVWPHAPTRYGIAIGTAFPRLVGWAMRRHYRAISRGDGGA